MAGESVYWDYGNREKALIMDWHKGDLRGKAIILLMDSEATKAAETLARSGLITVVVQDNGSLHKSKLVRQQWQRWQQLGLYIFFLPPYCSQMNPIETQWHQLKSHEIAGQIFDNEYDLAIAVIQGMTARSQTCGYIVERFIFNCT